MNDAFLGLRFVSRSYELFSASPKSATASAKLFSLIEIAKANRIEPYRHLNEVFTKLPWARTFEDYDALLPWKWLETADTAAILKKTAVQGMMGMRLQTFDEEREGTNKRGRS